LSTGHFFPEEAPEQTADALYRFFGTAEKRCLATVRCEARLRPHVAVLLTRFAKVGVRDDPKARIREVDQV
jgi:hypothetical protein